MNTVREVNVKELYMYLANLKSKEIVVDAENALLGRLASSVAKLLLMGFKVHVVNVEKALVSGSRKMIIESYKLLFNVKTHRNPYRQSMKRPRNPIAIFKGSVRRMLPKHSWRGVTVIKNLKAYTGVPSELSRKELIRITDINAKYIRRSTVVTLSEIAKSLGWKDLQ
ncbi:MAG: 50S ribosomal protein L13 [Ignisphaera sp.]|nr:50S ribosomal protein L13 [Ignisphaera sp.]MCX8167825.1 50S ribosomal protein L13 [Ignisphaera sp.]MDW8085810.1 50S ribosomal protein L13 [Ignisphaera sp.]